MSCNILSKKYLKNFGKYFCLFLFLFKKNTMKTKISFLTLIVISIIVLSCQKDNTNREAFVKQKIDDLNSLYSTKLSSAGNSKDFDKVKRPPWWATVLVDAATGYEGAQVACSYFPHPKAAFAGALIGGIAGSLVHAYSRTILPSDSVPDVHIEYQNHLSNSLVGILHNNICNDFIQNYQYSNTKNLFEDIKLALKDTLRNRNIYTHEVDSTFSFFTYQIFTETYQDVIKFINFESISSSNNIEYAIESYRYILSISNPSDKHIIANYLKDLDAIIMHNHSNSSDVNFYQMFSSIAKSTNNFWH